MKLDQTVHANKVSIALGDILPGRIFNILSISLLAILYLLLSVRYPVWNFDDISFIIKFGDLEFWAGLKQIFLGLDLPSEYRNYSFVRCFQFVLLGFLGHNPLPFYIVMTITHLASAIYIYILISQLSITRAGLNIDAFGCALIWTFSPFSICHTFHHFSYILLPFFFFLVYIYLVEKRLGDAVNSNQIWPSSVLVFILCLSGEGILLPLIAYLSIKIYQKSDAKFAGFHLLSVITTILAHYFLLRSFNNYSAEKMRFEVLFDFNALMINSSYFAESIKSAFMQGFQLTAVSYEPYYPLLKSYSFAWNDVSKQFVCLSVFLLILIIAPVFRALIVTSYYSKNRRSFEIVNMFLRIRNGLSNDRIRPNGLLVLLIMLLSFWSLYFGMSFAGAKLYGHPFALQIRYGYVILPTTLLVVFLAWRHLSSLAGQGVIRATSWIIPCLVCMSWLAYEINVAPLNAEQDKKIISILNDAAEDGVRVVSIAQNGFHEDGFFNKYPAFGITNPFVRWGDSPFQQNWTVSGYLGRFLGLRLELRPYIDWDSENVIFWSIGTRPELVNKSQFMLVGSKSLGSEPVSFPKNDLYVKRFYSDTYVDEHRAELISMPIRFDNGLELVRLTKTGLTPRLVFIWNGTKSQDVVFVHFLDKDGKMINQREYAYEDASEPFGGGELTANNNRIYVLPVQPEIWDRTSSVAIGLYQVAMLSRPQIYRKVLNGYSDGEGYRLRITVD